jgi:hypothetical protein
MSDDESIPLTETEVELLGTYRSWAKKGKLVDKLQQKMEKLAAREKIPVAKLIPPLPPPPPPPGAYNPLDRVGPELTPELEEMVLHHRYSVLDEIIIREALVKGGGGPPQTQYDTECYLALHGYYNDKPGDMPWAFRAPASTGKN